MAVVILLLQVGGFHDLRHDDAFISYRYGQNLTSGLGLVFNPGERIMGSTSPGHSLLAALVYLVAGKERLPTVMSTLGCVAWLAQAALLLLLLRRPMGWPAAVFIALCVAAGAAQSQYWVCLETNLVLVAVLAAVFFAFESRWTAAAMLCALAGFMRPDAFLLALPLGVLCLRERKAEMWKSSAAFLLAYAPWLVFAVGYYGTPIPQSAVSKFQRVDIATYARHLFELPAKQVAPFPLPNVALYALWLLPLVGVIYLVRKDRRFWILPVYGLLHMAGYLYLRPFTVHPWHLYPVSLLFAVFGLCAVAIPLAISPRAVLRALSLIGLAALLVAYTHRTQEDAATHGKAYW